MNPLVGNIKYNGQKRTAEEVDELVSVLLAFMKKYTIDSLEVGWSGVAYYQDAIMANKLWATKNNLKIEGN